MGRAGNRTDDDVIKLKAEFGFLNAHFFGKADEAQAAEPVYRGACRDGIGCAALVLDVFERAFPGFAYADVETFVDQFDLRTHDT